MKFGLTGSMAVCSLYFSIGMTQAAETTEQILPVIPATGLVAEASQSVDHEQALERSLREFDEKLLRELEETQQAREENARQKAALQSGAEAEGQGGEQAEGQTASAEDSESDPQSEQTASVSGQNNSGQDHNEQASPAERPAKTRSGAAAQAVTGDQAQDGRPHTQVADIPSGDDDDVIARQLREAAQAETDPRVKEKLWEEYRKYKNQQNTGS